MDYFGVSLSLANKVAGFFPSYDQKKRARLTRAKLAYLTLITREDRDHDLILDLRDEMEPLIKEVLELKK